MTVSTQIRIPTTFDDGVSTEISQIVGFDCEPKLLILLVKQCIPAPQAEKIRKLVFDTTGKEVLILSGLDAQIIGV